VLLLSVATDEVFLAMRRTLDLPWRLDWQMWFAALVPDCWRQRWFLLFERKLLEGSPAVLRLLRENPFPNAPPRYVRARLELYHFTRGRSVNWWEREDAGSYCPPAEL
jgi:hypothetical protein